MKITDTHVYFWNGPFSNWDYSPFTYEEKLFANVEQFFMWCKAIFFGDTETAAKILKTPDPEKVKALGREVKNYDDARWSEIRYWFMYYGVLLKFSQSEILRLQLKNTGMRILVEASPYDKIWGVGLGENDPLILDERNWKGQNLLGKVLVDVRRNLS